MPDAKTVIAVGFRVLRGSLRGVEEGTTFYQYTTTGVETIEETLIPYALLRISAVLEDAGYIAVPQRRIQTLRKSPEALNAETFGTEWYPSGAKEPQMDFVAAAVSCGLGERGESGSLLTDEFGPFQRIALVLTDAVLPVDPVRTPHLCDGCGECRKACPGHAMKKGGAEPVQCAAYYRGLNMRFNPFLDENAYDGIPNREAVLKGEADLTYEEAVPLMNMSFYYPPVRHEYTGSICGRACDRACYVHLEEKGVLSKRFVMPFRRRPVWELPMLRLKPEPK